MIECHRLKVKPSTLLCAELQGTTVQCLLQCVPLKSILYYLLSSVVPMCSSEINTALSVVQCSSKLCSIEVKARSAWELVKAQL